MAYPATAAPPRAYWFTPIAVISGYTSMPVARASRRQPRTHRTGSLASIGVTLPLRFAVTHAVVDAVVDPVVGPEQRPRLPAVGQDHDADQQERAHALLDLEPDREQPGQRDDDDDRHHHDGREDAEPPVRAPRA